MAYNYNVSGLNIDFAGLRAAKAKQEAYESEARTRDAILEKDKRYAEKYAMYRETGDAGILRDLMGLDTDRTKQIIEIDETLNEVEQQSLASAVLEAKYLADQGMISDARVLLTDRDDFLKQMQSSNQFTAPLAEAAKGASDLELLKMLDKSYEVAVGKGIITPPELTKVGEYNEENGDEYVMFKTPNGEIQKRYTGNNVYAEDGDDFTPFELNKELSVRRSKLIESAEGAQSRATQARTIAQGLSQAMASGIPFERSGDVGKIFDRVLGVVGGQDPLTSLRTNAKNLIAKEVVELLPAGAASDKDVEMMRQAMPDPYSNPKEFLKWLESYERLAAASAESGMLKAEWIERTGGGIVSQANTEMWGVKVKKGMRYDQFYDKFAKKKKQDEAREKRQLELVEKQRRDMEKFNRQEEELGNVLNAGQPPPSDRFKGFSILN